MKEQIRKIVEKMMYNSHIDMAYLNARLISTNQLHMYTFGSYKNYCRGEKDIVVCCPGPSLNKYKPIENAIHISVNRAFLFDKVHFDFIFAQDFDGIRMVQEQLIEYDCVKFLGTQGNREKQIPESLIIKANAKKFDTDWYIPGAGLGGEIVVDIERQPICNMINVGQSVMQLALFMNPRKIYIVGCDVSGNHFATGNQTDEEAARQAKLMENEWKRDYDIIIGRWKEIKAFAGVYYPETEIVSVNPIGLKGIFKDLYQK